MLLKMTLTEGFSVVVLRLISRSFSKMSVGVFFGSRGSSVVVTSVVVDGRNRDRGLVT